jgi:hypothetical protein
VNSLFEVKLFITQDFDFDSAIRHTCRLAGNSGAFLISEELPTPGLTSGIPGDEPHAADAGLTERWPITELDRGHLVPFAQIAVEERMKFDPYRSTREISHG